MKALTIFTLLTISISSFAKGGGRDNNNNSNPGINSSCDLFSANNRYWHKDQTNYPYEKVTCEFKEYLSISSKGPHCGTNTKARVIFLDNCTKNGVPQAGMAMTSYYPGYGCWNDTEINMLDSVGFEKMEIGSKVDVVVGVWGGMGKGSGVNIAKDIHQISVLGKTFCPTDHSMVPHVMMTVNPELAWLRETF